FERGVRQAHPRRHSVLRTELQIGRRSGAVTRQPDGMAAAGGILRIVGLDRKAVLIEQRPVLVWLQARVVERLALIAAQRRATTRGARGHPPRGWVCVY